MSKLVVKTPKTEKVTPKPTLSLPNITIRGIKASNLVSNQTYQRPVNERNVKLIKEGYSKELVNPIKVSLRNNKYYVFDGQHTLTVLTEMFGEDCIVPCIVYTGMTYQREAELFAKQDEFKRKLDIRERMKALYEGEDEEVRDFVRVCESEGFVCNLGSGGGNKSPLKIGNIAYTFNTVYKKKGEKHLRELLRIIKAAWSDEKEGTGDNVVKGIDIFISIYEGEYSAETLVNRLKKVSPLVIVRNGKADMTHTGATRFAVAVFDLYNKGLKTKLRSKF